MRRDVVVMGTHPFEPGVPLGDWHIARAIARRDRVLWVDPPVSPLAPLRGGGSAGLFRRRPQPHGNGLLVGSPVVPSGRVRPRHAGSVDRMVAAQVRRWMRQLGMVEPDVITCSARFGTLPGIPRRSLTAWIKDRDWEHAGAAHSSWLRERQAEVARVADVVSVVSPALVADCQRWGVGAVLIPNGCDTSAFAARRPAPPAIRSQPSPRVVFAGAWNWRVDGALVAAAASRLPAMTFVVVGAVRDEVPDAPNVVSLGPVPHADLPAYLQACSVGIVPYRAGAFNGASCPLKVYEYLAAGLPVVASGVETVGLPADLVRTCRVGDVDGFVAAIEELAAQELGTACRAESGQHSWERRAADLLAIVDRAVASRSIRQEVSWSST